MIPILYGGDEVHFTSNGIGRLTDTIYCNVVEERNGIFELELVYPVTGIHFDDIQIGTIIYTDHDASGDPQPFDVYRRTAEINGNVKFFAHHISYRLNSIVCMPFSASSSTVASTFAAMKNHAVSTVPFYFYTDKTNSANYNLNKPTTIRQMLGGEANSILDVYGTGEYKFDKWNVTLYVNRGADRHVSIRYGKNMTALEEDRSVENRYSAVVPFWVNPETGECVTLPEIAIVASSLPVEVALWTTETDAIMRTNGGTELEFNYPIVEYIAMDLSDEWEDTPTAAQLRAKAQSRLENSQAWLTDENLTVDFTIGDMPEALNHILLCDTVGVYFPALGVEVNKKVIRTEYDCLLGRYSAIELGNPKTTLFSAIEQRTGDILQSYVRRSYMTAAIENATNLITGGTGGHVVFGFNADGQPEEIMIMDTDSIATAVNVIRINKNGIGFSTTGYNGTYTTAWTIDGHFVADFIDTGTLAASLIKSGEIQALNGESYWSLDDGILGVKRTVAGTSWTFETRLESGWIRFFVEENETSHIQPNVWSGAHTGSKVIGTSFYASENSGFLALGYTDGGTQYIAGIVNNGLNPNGNTERLLLYDNLRCTGYIAADTNIWARKNVIVSKDVTSSSGWWKNVIALHYEDNEGGSLRFTWPKNDGTDDFNTKIIVNCSQLTGEVNISSDTLDLVKTGNANYGTALLRMLYSGTYYNFLTNWNNGNISINACGGYIYLGYSHTTGIRIGEYFTAKSYYSSAALKGLQVSDGSLYLGTVIAANDYTLVVNGDYSVYAKGTISAQTLTQRSDETLKNVLPYDSRYDDLIDALTPISFTWKDDDSGKTHVGLGARATKALIEENGIENSSFVSADVIDGNEIYSINYNELSVMLLSKVQKLTKENELLRKRLDDIEKRLEKLGL